LPDSVFGSDFINLFRKDNLQLGVHMDKVHKESLLEAKGTHGSGLHPKFVKRLQAHHHKMIQLCVEGVPPNLIATKMNCSRAAVSNVINSPLAKAEIARLRSKVEEVKVKEFAEVQHTADQILANNSGAAAKVMSSLLLSQNEKIQHIAAADILDRTGFPKISRNDSTMMDVKIILTENAVARIQGVTQSVFGKNLLEPSLVDSCEISKES